MTAKEELIKIIRKIFRKGKIPYLNTPEEIADAILDADFVRYADVNLDGDPLSQ